MKLQFELVVNERVGPISLGDSRDFVLGALENKPETFMKTPISKHPTDAFFESGFQVFYEGDSPIVDAIELSRGCGFDIILSGVNILDLPVEHAIDKIEKITGFELKSDDDGYTYEISELGLWLWRPIKSGNEGAFFETIGICKVENESNA